MGHYIRISEPCGVRRWRVTRARLPQNQHASNWGYCDYATRVIAIHNPLAARTLLSTLMHEAIHAACPDLHEDAVRRIEASACSAVLPFLAEIVEGITEDDE